MKTGRHYKGLLLLGMLLIAVPFLVWKTALQGTAKTIAETSKLKAIIVENEKTSLNNPRQIVVTENVDLITDGLILDRLAPCTEANNLKVIEYQPYLNEKNGGLTLLSAEITVTGSYISIVRLINELENEVPECRVKSVEFNKTQERKERTEILKAVIILQQLISG